MDNSDIFDSLAEKERRNILAISSLVLLSVFIRTEPNSKFNIFGMSIPLDDNQALLYIIGLLILLYMNLVFYINIKRHLTGIKASNSKDLLQFAKAYTMKSLKLNGKNQDFSISLVGLIFHFVNTREGMPKLDVERENLITTTLQVKLVFYRVLFIFHQLSKREWWYYRFPIVWSFVTLINVIVTNRIWQYHSEFFN